MKGVRGFTIDASLDRSQINELEYVHEELADQDISPSYTTGHYPTAIRPDHPEEIYEGVGEIQGVAVREDETVQVGQNDLEDGRVFVYPTLQSYVENFDRNHVYLQAADYQSAGDDELRSAELGTLHPVQAGLEYDQELVHEITQDAVALRSAGFDVTMDAGFSVGGGVFQELFNTRIEEFDEDDWQKPFDMLTGIRFTPTLEVDHPGMPYMQHPETGDVRPQYDISIDHDGEAPDVTAFGPETYEKQVWVDRIEKILAEQDDRHDPSQTSLDEYDVEDV